MCNGPGKSLLTLRLSHLVCAPCSLFRWRIDRVASVLTKINKCYPKCCVKENIFCNLEHTPAPWWSFFFTLENDKRKTNLYNCFCNHMKNSRYFLLVLMTLLFSDQLFGIWTYYFSISLIIEFHKKIPHKWVSRERNYLEELLICFYYYFPTEILKYIFTIT